MEKHIAKGVNLRHGIQQKRIWFAVPDDSVELARFYSLCEQINNFVDVVDLHTLLHLVIELLQHHGFEWIAK